MIYFTVFYVSVRTNRILRSNYLSLHAQYMYGVIKMEKHKGHEVDLCYGIEFRFRNGKLRGRPIIRKKVECETCGEIIFDKVLS